MGLAVVALSAAGDRAARAKALGSIFAQVRLSGLAFGPLIDGEFKKKKSITPVKVGVAVRSAE